MEFAKIQRSKIYEEIAEQLRAQIAAGVLKPGDKLPSAKELTERFQVGRSTVREALSALQAMGLIETRQGEGSYVKAPPADGLQQVLGIVSLGRKETMELLEARKALEAANASIAAQKRTDADLARMESLLARMKQHLGDETIGEQADVDFHMALAEATHNSIMVRLLETISAQMEKAIRETRRLQLYADRAVSERLWSEHHAIVEAVRVRDSELAHRKMLDHLLHVESVLHKFLQDA
jgi:GntR family transcriptional repressor for pyruvate dehydrogenase complex